MPQESIFDRYAREALKDAEYEELGDGSVVGRVPLMGVTEVGRDRERCEEELRSQIADWARESIRFGDRVPIIAGIDLNTAEARAQAQE